MASSQNRAWALSGRRTEIVMVHGLVFALSSARPFYAALAWSWNLLAQGEDDFFFAALALTFHQ